MTDDDYETNTKGQYEALGRFVEAFELMVAEVRDCAIQLLQKDIAHRKLIASAMHHHSLTAKPLFDIFRTVIAEIVDDAISHNEFPLSPPSVLSLPPLRTGPFGKPLRITSQDRDAINGIMSVLNAEYDDLFRMRNNLLHATWFVGYKSGDDPTAKEFYAQKFTTSKKGLSVVDLPKNAGQLNKLSDRCETARLWIGSIGYCFFYDRPISDTFGQDGTWYLITSGDQRSRLPDG